MDINIKYLIKKIIIKRDGPKRGSSRERDSPKMTICANGPNRNNALPLDVQSTATPQRISGRTSKLYHNSSANSSTSVDSDLHLVSCKLQRGQLVDSVGSLRLRV